MENTLDDDASLGGIPNGDREYMNTYATDDDASRATSRRQDFQSSPVASSSPARVLGQHKSVPEAQQIGLVTHATHRTRVNRLSPPRSPSFDIRNVSPQEAEMTDPMVQSESASRWLDLFLGDDSYLLEGKALSRRWADSERDLSSSLTSSEFSRQSTYTNSERRKSTNSGPPVLGVTKSPTPFQNNSRGFSNQFRYVREIKLI